MTETAVIVPVLARPRNAEPFMTSLRASLRDMDVVRVYAVTQDGDVDTFNAWAAAGASILTAAGSSFAVKVNHGYRMTGESWLFVTGDDVRFHPGWLRNAQLVASRRYHVVGTNDLGNPRVTSGQHATHLLVRRSYVDEQGGGWDGPKVLAHEGYRHWFVDDEIVTAARQRGVWAMALSSVVEHLHPLWGKGADDDVYELGRAHADTDRVLFEARLREHAT